MGSQADDPAVPTTEEFARWWSETGEHELRQILFWRWDPIGVFDSFPNTADEYDGYAPQVDWFANSQASWVDFGPLRR